MVKMSKFLKAKEILSTALKVPEEKIDCNTAIGITPEWDSLAHMRLILALEEVVGEKLNMIEVVDIENLTDIISTLERHNL
jgi:acyl carrier protein